eukprot:10256480-Heterocapsa_arctica.AAC.1
MPSWRHAACTQRSPFVAAKSPLGDACCVGAVQDESRTFTPFTSINDMFTPFSDNFTPFRDLFTPF